MIVVMQQGSNEEQVQAVIDRMVELDFTVHRSTGVVHTVLGGVGPEERLNPAEFEEMDGVKECHRIIAPYKLAGRHYRPDRTRIGIGSRTIGGPALWIAAGLPESDAAQMRAAVAAIAEAGAAAIRPRPVLRAGDDLLKVAHDAAKPHGLSLIVEVADAGEVALADWHADILEVPSRSMQQHSLLVELGRLRKPVILERGHAATVEELLIAAEVILSGGNDQVILCESGIRTFVSARNTMDLAAIAVARKYSHLPILVNPSTGTGRRGMVPAMARAAVAAGADGLLLDVQPGLAVPTNAAALTAEAFATLHAQLDQIAAVTERGE